ncbi:unnamed protein product [Gulo gulo]|uniref:Uncharacterized protein n=1 Tax=Gulo gulo TaxID=48420 RepID=A0A9X9Q2W2_GULGU|nr:unnamed protein product [Gulo gulo]
MAACQRAACGRPALPGMHREGDISPLSVLVPAVPGRDPRVALLRKC